MIDKAEYLSPALKFDVAWQKKKSANTSKPNCLKYLHYSFFSDIRSHWISKKYSTLSMLNPQCPLNITHSPILQLHFIHLSTYFVLVKVIINPWPHMYMHPKYCSLAIHNGYFLLITYNKHFMPNILHFMMMQCHGNAFCIASHKRIKV